MQLVCQRWSSLCDRLTGQYWKQTSHRWEGEKFTCDVLVSLASRLHEIESFRVLLETLVSLLSASDRLEFELEPSAVFAPLINVGYSSLGACGPFADQQWRGAFSKVDRVLSSAEQKAVQKLRLQLNSVDTSDPYQLFRVFQSRQELLKRATICKELHAEREVMQSHLLVILKKVDDDFSQFQSGKAPVVSKNMPELVANMMYVRQLLSRVEDCSKLSEAVLSDLPSHSKLEQQISDLNNQLRNWLSEKSDEWSRETLALIDSGQKGLELRGNVMEFGQQDKKLTVNYSDRLVVLLKETNYMQSLGYSISPKILKTAATGKKFYKYAIVLQQVAHFYNTIEQQMLPCQQAMMLNTALEFERMIKKPKGDKGAEKGSNVQVTWDSSEELEAYIKRLQKVAEKLTNENRKLRQCHQNIIEKIARLMNINLLKHQQQWKEILMEIRHTMATLVDQGFTADGMRPWREHLDRQLYKALEHQWLMGLEALNENQSEIQADLVLRNGKIQFHPPFEQIKARYYREMKKFISIPTVFRGVGDRTEGFIFPSILDRHPEGLITCFQKASLIFDRLERVTQRFEDMTALGRVDIEEFVEKHLKNTSEFEDNFKALKIRGADIEKLPGQIKIDCIVVNVNPFKLSCEDLLQQLQDALTHCLRSRCQQSIQQIEQFVQTALTTLTKRPQTVEEVTEASMKHGEFSKEKVAMQPLFHECELQNKLLRQTVGRGVDSLQQLQPNWDRFEVLLESHQLMVRDQVEVIKGNVKTEIKNTQQNVEKFAARWNQLKPKDDLLFGTTKQLLDAIQSIKDRKNEFEELDKEMKKLTSECEHFGLDNPDFAIAERLKADIEQQEQMWSLFEEFHGGLDNLRKEDWISFRSKTYQFEEFLSVWFEKLKGEDPSPMVARIQKEVDKFRTLCPAFKWVRGEALGQDHWLELFRLLNMPKGMTLEKLNFGNILDSAESVIDNVETLKELNSRAQGEVTIREALRELEVWGVSAVFQLTEQEDSNKRKVSLIKEWKDLINQVGDNQNLLQSVKESPWYKYFEDKASVWEKRLADLAEYLSNLNQIQRKWVYLEPIFGRGALPKEQDRFRKTDSDFRSIMSDVARDSRVVSLANKTGMRNLLSNMLDQLQRCQKSLNEYLEEKRSKFPRFYFIGDDDLLEILGRSQNPEVIQTHLKKLFAGIHKVGFSSDSKFITQIKSQDGEVVDLKRQVQITPEVEVWLSSLAHEMVETLKDLLVKYLREAKGRSVDPSLYPSQILCVGEMILFTSQCEEAIQASRLDAFLGELKQKLSSYTNAQIQCQSEVLELKLKALIFDVIHNMDVVEYLLKERTRSVSQWPWQKQLRFYLVNNACKARMVDSEIDYTYEYQGNAPKLVHTPLTDKCYLTLSQGLRLGLGGNPYGPAGTGKTESVKALGNLVGRQVLVFNCDEGIDVKSMGRIFIGLVKSGAWGCFDEFNRLDEQVLSAVSQQIQVIQDAIRQRNGFVKLLGRDVDVNLNAGIFITLNPAGKGYGGRQKLPDNLKQLFRPVAMSKPDNDLIAEVILYSEGYKHAKTLGRKLVSVFQMSRELLTQQQHYDWGLRALKTVLKGCGSLLAKFKKEQQTSDVSQEIEYKLVVQAVRLNTLSKLTFFDSKAFDDLIRDVFPGIEITDFEYAELKKALEESCQELGFQINKNQLRKAVELYEQLRQRIGVVVVGPSGAGKTALWRLLRTALTKMNKTIKEHLISPKAMPRHQLLGHVDLDTMEWSDGVLTFASRQVVKEELSTQSWIVLDGDIDPEWVESLNSVLDDNRLLTMPSGERIQFGPNVNFLFETDDLSSASPATISRMGMIFLSDEDTDLKAIITAWLETKTNEEQRQQLSTWIDEYLYRSVEWAIKANDFVVATSQVGVVKQALSHLLGISPTGCPRSRSEFAVALLRGIGGNLSEGARDAFAKQLFTWIGEQPPDSSRPLDCRYSEDIGRLVTYTSDESSFQINHESIMNSLSTGLPAVKTADFIRNVDTFEGYLNEHNQQPFIVVGPDGCGKSLMLRYCLNRLRSTSVAIINCSTQTTPQHVLEKLYQTCMVINTNTGRVLRPKEAERLILYLKDLNLPKPDKWGTCQLISFLQEALTYNGFHDKNLDWVGLEGIQIVASMNASQSAGRNKLSTRFTSVVRICSVGYLPPDQLQSIYTAFLKPILGSRVSKDHQVWRNDSKVHALAVTILETYEQIRAKFTIDDQVHYVFTPRDLTQWVIGLFRYDFASDRGSPKPVLEAVAYEGMRIFGDRMVDSETYNRFAGILSSAFRNEWNFDPVEHVEGRFFTTWGARGDGVSVTSSAAVPLPPTGRALGSTSNEDLHQVVQKTLQAFTREVRDANIVVFEDVLQSFAQVDRVLTMPGGSLILAGPVGCGRRTAAHVVAHAHAMKMFTPKITRNYGMKQFRQDLKQIMQWAGVEGEQVVLMMEEYQMIDQQLYEYLNSLLSSGEIAGLYTPEELEPIVQQLRAKASEAGYTQALHGFFAQRIRTNLHIVIILDYPSPQFASTCQSNPAFVKKCNFVVKPGWSKTGMLQMTKLYLSMPPKEERDADEKQKKSKKRGEGPLGGEEIIPILYQIHQTCPASFATPKRFVSFLSSYMQIVRSKEEGSTNRRDRLKAGVSRLTEARDVVAKLKGDAAEKSEILSRKQAEADEALGAITKSMGDAGEQKQEMERLKVEMADESVKMKERKKKIDAELSEIQPLVDEAKEAVGNIRSDALSEIRSLRAPPDIVRDILEGVLRLMGIFDTSWNSMKNFLAKRTVKEEIQHFDAHKITPQIRKGVEELLERNKASFNPENAKRASVAASPLAAWVKANVKFAYVLERIEPLESEQSKLQRNMDKANAKMKTLTGELSQVDQKVSGLRNKFEKTTTEAAKLKMELEDAQKTIAAAEMLVSRLEDEYQRWNTQLSEIASAHAELPRRAALAAAFVTYLARAPEDARRGSLKTWQEIARKFLFLWFPFPSSSLLLMCLGVNDFDLRYFLSTESELLQWKSEGLASDSLSQENALGILQVGNNSSQSNWVFEF